MFILKTKQTRQTDGEALVQCSFDGFRVLGLNFGGKWKKLAESRMPEMPTFRMYGLILPNLTPMNNDWKNKTFNSQMFIFSQMHLMRRYSSIKWWALYAIMCWSLSMSVKRRKTFPGGSLGYFPPILQQWPGMTRANAVSNIAIFFSTCFFEQFFQPWLYRHSLRQSHKLGLKKMRGMFLIFTIYFLSKDYIRKLANSKTEVNHHSSKV